MNDEPIPLEDEIYEEEIEVEEEPSVMMAMWGEITGDIDNQTDLKEALDAKQDNLTQSQLDAVNSGINSTKVETYDGYQAQINTKASQSALEAEAEARRQADSTLQGNIDAEETARKASDKDIQDVLDGETLARQNADTALGGRIDTEIHDRQVADIGLQGQIDAITSKSDVVDVVATYADLQAYDTQHLGDNDVIKVLDDETHGDALAYYRWSKTNQTWTFIGQEAPYYSKSQTDTLLLDKQGKIDSAHKLSADLVDDTDTTNKFVTAEDKTNWNAKQDALTAGQNIDITNDVISTPAIAPEVVAELPATGTEGKLYLTPKNYTRGTGTGNPITATITDEAGKMESFKLDGDTEQQTYTGKNLCRITLPNLSIVVYSDNTITLNGSRGTGNLQDTTNIGTRLAAGTYTVRAFLLGGSASGDGTRLIMRIGNNVFTIRSDISGVSEPLSVTLDSDTDVTLQIWVDNSTTYNNLKIGYQIEAGSTATAYEPYVGGTPSPNPDYPQPIQTVTGEQTVTVVGKNLISASWESGRYNNSTGAKEPYSDNVRTDAPIAVQPNTTYICSRNGSGLAMNVLQYKADGSFISATTISSGNSLTTGANTYFVTMYRGTSGGTEGIQLELGSTISSYAPYHATSYPLDLGTIELCKLGTYQDYIYKDGDEWKVHKKCKTVTLDGSENWQYSSTYSFFYAGDIPSMETPINAGVACYCRTHKGLTSSSSGPDFATEASNYPYAADVHTTQALVRIKDTRFSSTQALATWLEQNNTTIYYVVKTATDTTITDTTLIAQLEAIRTAILENGTNTITNTATGSNLAGDMEIGYYGYNPRNRYDKFIWLDLNNNYEQIGGE